MNLKQCFSNAVTVALGLALSGCAGFGLDSSGPGDYDATAARAQYKSMMNSQVSSAPKFRDIDQQPSAVERLREGDHQRDQGRTQEAVIAYFRAAQLEPRDMTPMLRIAYLQLVGNPQAAEVSFRDVIKKEPEMAEAWLGLGLAQFSQGKAPEARISLEKAIEISPDAVAIRTPLGAVYDRLGEHALAQEQFHMALAAKPNGLSELNNLAVSLMMSGDYQGAEVYLRKAIRVSSTDEATLNNLGLSLAFQGRTVEAIEVFTRAVGRQAAFNNLGYVYYLNGKNEEAQKAYEHALLMGGDHEESILENLRDLHAAQAVQTAQQTGGEASLIAP